MKNLLLLVFLCFVCNNTFANTDPKKEKNNLKKKASTTLGIGTAAPGTYKLAVNGHIHTKEVKVDLIGWGDYVFSTGYNLPTLKEVEQHIKERRVI